MPGQKSLDENQYYAHPRNAFWKIITTIYAFNLNLSYKQRCEELTKNKIALWDVMQHCERQGSLDSAIKNDTIIPNDFKSFLAEHPNVKKICFNGKKAESSFRKLVFPTLNSVDKYRFISLPSTSPAHASMPFEGKLQLWENALTQASMR